MDSLMNDWDSKDNLACFAKRGEVFSEIFVSLHGFLPSLSKGGQTINKHSPFRNMQQHPITFVSLGIGDPELVTLKSYRALQQADIIYTPSTLRRDGNFTSRAGDIIRALLPDAPICHVDIPMSHDRSNIIPVYETIKENAATDQATGKRVAVAVEGDVSIYASVHYVARMLMQDGRQVDILPGIASFIGAAANQHLSLISGQERLLVIPGSFEGNELDDSRQVVVVMKLSQCEETVKQYLKTHSGIECHYFENVGLPHAYHSADIDEILNRPFPYFSLLIMKHCR